MNTSQTSFSVEQFAHYLLSAVMVGVVAGLMLLIGRDQLGEAVVALLFLVPIGLITSRWGQGPGIFAAVMAALAFDFFFIPPFYTLVVARLEGWLVLAIFLAVAILVVGRIQSSLSKAQTSEHEAILMYELSAALASLRTQEAVAHTVAPFIHQRYQANLVNVVIQPKGHSSEIYPYVPQNGVLTGKPDRVLPLLNDWGLVGEIQIWERDIKLPSIESRIFRNFASQIGQAIERTRLTEAGAFLSPALQNTKVKQRKNV
jgi:K+-sensing histidine kinase KdpD